MKWSAKKIAITIIPIYLLIIGLIFAVAFLFVYAIQKDDTDDVEDNVVLLSLKDISFDTYLQRGKTNQDLLTFYNEPHSNPYVDVAYTYEREPIGLSFRIVDSSGTVVGNQKTLTVDTGDYRAERYPFTNTGSTNYTVQYSLSSSTNNTNNVAVDRIELKAVSLG
jgi:hypothetical protein